MAIIGKIREKSALLVIIIGIALLAFILGDWRKTGFGDEEQIGYGTVYGDKVDVKRFEENSAKFKEQDSQQAQQQQAAQQQQQGQPQEQPQEGQQTEQMQQEQPV